MFLQVFTGGGLVLLCLFSPLCVSPFQFDTSWGMWTSVGVVCYMFSKRFIGEQRGLLFNWSNISSSRKSTGTLLNVRSVNMY